MRVTLLIGWSTFLFYFFRFLTANLSFKVDQSGIICWEC